MTADTAMIGRFWDDAIKPILGDLPDDGLTFLRHKYIEEVLANPSVIQTIREVESLVADFGDTIVITTPEASWRVPRRWIAAHGIAAERVPELANRFGWEKL